MAKNNSVRFEKVSLQFWFLAAFSIVVFFTGGSSRADVPSLLLLRPVTFLFLGLALLTLTWDHVAKYKVPATLLGLSVLLHIVYLIPLPPIIWQSLPARDLIVEADSLFGFRDTWRPISLTPSSTVDSLLFLFTPLTAFALAIQLGRDDRVRLLLLLMGIGATSAVLGLIQVIGSVESPLYLYPITNRGSAVGLFANRNHASVFLASMIPLLAAFSSIRLKRVIPARIRNAIVILSIALCVPLLLVTGSRAGLFVGLLGILAATMIYKPAKDELRVRKGGMRWRFEPSLFLLGLLAMVLALITAFFAKAEAVNRLFHTSVDTDLRVQFWENTLDLAWRYFPIGTGPGSFPDVYKITEPLAQLMPTYVNHAHNDYLEVILTLGLPGLVLILLAGYFIINRAGQIWRHETTSDNAILLAKTASIAIFMLAVASIPDYPLRTPALSIFLVFAIVWLFADLRTPQESHSGEMS